VTGSLPGSLPSTPELGLFALAVLLLNATPGVDLLLTVTRTLQSGARAGMAAALGIAAGCVVHALAAAFGLAALLVLHPQAFVATQWAGAGYLVWVGVGLLRGAFRGGVDSAQAAVSANEVSFLADIQRGLLTNVLNPKVALFFLAFLPQFVPAQAASKTAAFLLLGAWFVVQGLLFLFATVWLASTLRRWQTLQRASRVLSGLAGASFVALALRLVSTRPAGA
jgi:threonine/homoserine/homoserine lactone efflux protein